MPWGFGSFLFTSVHFSHSVVSDSVIPWSAAHQASLPITSFLLRLRIKKALIGEMSLPRWHSGRESPCQCRRHERHRFHPWVGKTPRGRQWQPTAVFLPGESRGQRGAWWAAVHGATESRRGWSTCSPLQVWFLSSCALSDLCVALQ